MSLSESQRSNLEVALRELKFLGEHVTGEQFEEVGSIHDRVDRALKEDAQLKRGNLEQRLDAFRDAMLAKFWARHEKQHARGNKSVCDSDFDWSRDIDPRHLEAHLEEELREWLEPGANRKHESVDVANMLFLGWTTRGDQEP